MTIKNFSQHLQALEATSSRLKMTELLAEVFKDLDPQEAVVASYLLQSRLRPAYEAVEFSLSTKLVLRALARLGQTEAEDLTKDYKKLGDVGLVAEAVRSQVSTTPQNLTLTQVYELLLTLAKDEGAGSQERKIEALADLLIQVDHIAAKFITRIIIGRLRLGFSTMTMLDALSWSVAGDKSEAKILEDTYQKKADIGELAKLYLSLKKMSPDDRRRHLAGYQVAVGVPVMPALCQRLNSAQEIIDKMGKVYAEPKYDGLRVQIHFRRDGLLRVFTRNLEPAEHMFPELAQMAQLLNGDSCILDAEVVGITKGSDKLLTFQETSTRRRKHDVAQTAQAIPIRFYVFDILERNGQELLTKPLHERKDELKKLFSKNELFFLAPFIVTQDPNELHTFHTAQLGVGLEGAVIKQYDGTYQSGRKGWNWVKIKEEEGTKGKLADTLDCVVMGYYSGRGKRTSFGLGAILVGVRDEAQDVVVTLAKIGTGLTEAQLREIKHRCDALAMPHQPATYRVHKDLVPDVWVNPELVLEIAADEITRSPIHTAGVALRFPRLVKIREDKGSEQATTLKEVEQLK